VEVPLPAYQSEGAAGMDLCAAVRDPVQIPPGERRLIPTGVGVAIPRGFEGQVRPRSGLALRHGVTVLNAPGTVDSDYRGELMVALINHGSDPFVVARGERIAQLVICPVAEATLDLVSSLDETARGEGGYGSTGRGGGDDEERLGGRGGEHRGGRDDEYGYGND
jgi:dUTP pyrophosphatase